MYIYVAKWYADLDLVQRKARNTAKYDIKRNQREISILMNLMSTTK